MSSPRFSRATTACGGRRSPPAKFSAEPSSSARIGDLRTLPCQLPDPDSRLAGLDGFYAARLEKL